MSVLLVCVSDCAFYLTNEIKNIGSDLVLSSALYCIQIMTRPIRMWLWTEYLS